MHEVTNILALTDEHDDATRRRALLTVAHYSNNADECREFAMALGLIGAEQ